MKTVYITEGQIKAVENAVIKEDGARKTLLNEENSTDRKKVERIISEFCVDMIKPYLLRPLEDCDLLTANNDVESTTTYQSVKNNQHGFNRLIDYLRLNLYEQFGMTRDNGPARFRIGIARIACDDLGFYSFGQNLQGGKLIKFAKLMKLFAYKPDIMFEGGEEPDKNLNGMSYDEIMQEYGNKMERYIHQQKADINSDAINDPNSILEPTRSTEDRDASTPPEVYRCGDYKIYHINDTISNYQVSPTYACRNFLDWLGNYTQWCICGGMGAYEYAQYMGNGGNLYIMLKDGFQNIQREQGENCPLDEYGLSMIAVIVGTDGLPDNVTTRWNHDFGGENHSDMWEARQLQKLTGVKYSSIFKPRSQEQLRQMYLSEEAEKPSAMDQVHNKVNAGVMDAVTCGGMMEEGQGNTETWYRGYNSKYGSDRTHLLWLTDDISYARAYGNRVEEILVDMDKLNAASIYEMDGICGYEIDYYEGIDKEDAEKAMQEGVGGYEFEVAENEGYYCLCLWDKSAIISRRELPKEEFDNIEPIDGYDNPAYDAEMKEMFCEGLISENSNDRKVNKYIKEKFGLTDFQDIRNKVMEIYEKIPYARINGGRYMLGVMRLLFDENLPREEYGVLNKILYKIGNSNYYERGPVNDNNLGGWNFEQLKEKYFIPDFEGDKFSTSEKIVKLPNGYTVTRIDTYDEMNARCDGEWCISYDENMWYELIPDETVYLVENEELINKFDEAMEDKDFANKFEEISYAAGEEDDMDEMGLINSDLAWTNKLGSWKFPYDIYGLSRFVVLVGEKYLTVYSRYNMPNEFDGDYLNKEQLEKLLGINFNDVFKYIPRNDSNGHYDNYGRWRVDAAPAAVNEGKDSDYNFPKRVAKLKNGEIVVHNDFDFEHHYTGIEGINYISKDNSLVSKKWFDTGTKFDYWNDYAIVYYNRKGNLLDRNGRLVLKNWYDEVTIPRKDGKIRIKDGSKINYASTEKGTPISKIWFDEISPFKKINGKYLAIVRVGNKYNYIDEAFKLVNKSWADSIGALDIVAQRKRASKKFDDIKKISDSLLKVKKDGKFGIADSKGKLLTFDWYDRIGEYADGRAIVAKDGKFNYITEKGNIISNKWFDNAYEFVQGTAIVAINGKQYTIDLNGKVINISEGAEPEADEYKIGGEGGNNEYFHAINESKIGNFDFKKYFKPIAEFMREDGLNVYPYPKIKLNWEPQDGLFIKTGYYEPETKTIVIFCDDRHPKDILRTFCHEMIHHSQNLDGVDLSFSSDDDVKDNERLEEIESEAYLKGNVYFRKWTEYAKKDSKDVLQEGRKKVVKNDEGEIVPEKCDKCGGDVVCQIHGEPVYVCKECGKYFGTVPFNLDESIDIHKALAALRKRRDPAGIEDWNSINEDTDPEDIDLSSFNIKTALNPKFWKDGHLDSRIRMKLLDIADDFIEFLGVDWVKPDDIIMTGSLANYNWNKKFSDIDLHILMDYSKVDKRKDFVDNYFYSQKKLWNDEHQDLKIFGFPVELYVQDTKEKHASTGVYSLDKDKWLKEPEREKLSTAKINKGLIKKKVAEYIDKIEDLLTIYKTADDDYKVRKVSEKADSLFDEIKKERRDSLGKKNTEITNGNIIFKCLRRLGYIEKLVNLKSETYDKMNSLS